MQTVAVPCVSDPAEIAADLKGRVVAGTGHRPDKLLGYDTACHAVLVSFVAGWLRALAPARVISGMALGFDMALAQAALVVGVPYTAATVRGQENRWTPRWRYLYGVLVSNADSVVQASTSATARGYLARDRWMVDNAGLVLALYRGDARGGTAYTVAYAAGANVDVLNIWPAFEAKYKESPAWQST